MPLAHGSELAVVRMADFTPLFAAPFGDAAYMTTQRFA